MKKNKKKYIRKVLFTILISFAVILFWRGIWGLADFYLFPNNYHLSLWVSLGIGLLILLLVEDAIKEII